MLIIHSLSDDVLAALLVPFEGIETRQSPETSHEWWTHIVEHFPRIQALQQRQVTFRELANRMFVEREKNREVFFSMKADKQCTYLNAFLDSWFRALALALVPGDPCLARESDLTAALVLALEASPYGRAASDEFARRPHQPLAELIASIARDAQSHADGALAERNLSYEPTEVERNAMRHYDTGRRSAWFFWNLSQFHITHDRKDFVTYTQYSPRRQLTTGHKVLGFGTVLLWPVIPGVKDAVPPLVFTNVLHVPAYEHKVMGNVDEVGSVHLCQAGVKVMVATPQSESSDDDDAEDDDHDSNTADDRPRRRRGIDGDMDDAALFHAGRLRCSGRMFRQLFCLNVRGTVWDKPDTQPRLMRFTPPVEFERE
ncbi:hypothetical protein GGF31_000835 [Allomyces arbusculus]|nr:hypothetical protein GGF31_000835 [Allomyces arbusculus]